MEEEQTRMEDEQSQNGMNESFLRGAAKAVALGAVLGAAVGAVTAASRQAGGHEEPEGPEAEPSGGKGETEELRGRTPEEPVDEAPEVEEEAPQAREEPELDEESEEPDEGPQAREEPEPDEEPRVQAEPEVDDGPPPAGLEIVSRARRQLAELTGRSTEGVLGFEQTDDGWRVTVEVVELPRIPSSTDVLAAYDVLVDESGNVRKWHRAGRYIRSRGEEDSA
jgi:Gas vesicle synthesis protein GvpO